MEKYTERFNLHNPEYKTVEDLPEERRREFVNIPEEEGGGFVRAEAMKAYEWWQQKAAEVNQTEEEKKRNSEEEYQKKSFFGKFFHKIYLVDKAISLDFARQEAEVDFAEDREYREDEDIASLKNLLLNGFLNIFIMSDGNKATELGMNRPGGILDFIKQGLFNSVISEDKSGRLPAEVMQKFINKIYKGYGRDEIKLFPMKLSRADARNGEHVRRLIRDFTELAQSGELGNYIYVTEYVYHGGTIEKALHILAESSRVSGTESGVVFVTLGGGNNSDMRNLVITGKQGEHGGIGKYSGVSELDPKRAVTRARIIEEVSDRLVSHYESWLKGQEFTNKMGATAA